MKIEGKHTFLPEDQLVDQLKAKSTDALEYLYDNYSQAIFGVIMKIVNHQEMGEEVLQDVFVKVWNKIEDYDKQKGRLFTWMINIARNMAIDRLRSREFSAKSKTSYGFDNVHVEDNNSGEAKADAIGMDKVLAQLPEEQKQLIEMMYFQGYSQSEVAKELDMPLGTVKTRVRSAMAKLREVLK